MSDSTKINTEYVPESHLPAWSLGEVADRSNFWQRRYRKTHDKDGTHNDELIPHAFAICGLTGGGVTMVKSEGFAAALRVGAGLVKFTLTNPLVLINDLWGWQLVAWPYDDGASGKPYYAYEVPGTGGSLKTTTISWIQICDKNGNAYDIDFSIAAYGVRV